MTSVGSMDDDVREILARTAAAADLSLRSSASPASSLDSAFAQPLRELQLQEQDRAVTETVERMRRVLASSFDRQLRLGDHPARVADSPPPWAKTFYKVRPPTPLHQLPRPAGRTGSRLRQVLAFVDGQYLSVFDGRTVYSPGQTARPRPPLPPGHRAQQRAPEQHPSPLLPPPPCAQLCQLASPGHAGGFYVFRSLEDCLRRDADVFPASSELVEAPRVIARCACWNHRRDLEPVRYGHKARRIAAPPHRRRAAGRRRSQDASRRRWRSRL